MNQLTIRGFDDHVARRLKELARERDVSLNKAAVILLRRGADAEEPTALDQGQDQGKIGDSLDSFAGVWTEEEEREFLDALAPLEQIDEELWP